MIFDSSGNLFVATNHEDAVTGENAAILKNHSKRPDEYYFCYGVQP